MPKLLTTPKRSELMSRIKQSGTAGEIKVRSIFESLGSDFQVNVNSLPGRPDLANVDNMWAVFVHGCFWHAHENCKRWKIPKTNQEFWRMKFKKNRERDTRKLKELLNLGYTVLVIWECELAKEDDLVKKIGLFISGCS